LSESTGNVPMSLPVAGLGENRAFYQNENAIKKDDAIG
jgi:hypothetical protein